MFSPAASSPSTESALPSSASAARDSGSGSAATPDPTSTPGSQTETYPPREGVPLEHLFSLVELHRLELASLYATLNRYREILIEHGLAPPDDAGDLALRELHNYRTLMLAAVDFVDAADSFRASLGTSKELLTPMRP